MNTYVTSATSHQLHAHQNHMPASIVKAICEVMKTVDALAKNNRNQFAKYNYVSADDIYAALVRKLADVGLVIIPEENEPVKHIDINGEPHAIFNYRFVLAVGEDTYSSPRLCRSMWIKVTGPQTFGAAESYLQKTFLRGLFKIPTGDHDLDEVAPEAPTRKPAKKAKSPDMPEKASIEVVEAAKAFLDGITERPISPAQQKEYVENFGALASQMPKEHADELRSMLKEANRDPNS